ncbi:hypothetical protein E4U47_003002 [Claviceps purpurea]|nr:hypothetical protein E4U47_003002 [Claviceps purpurea]
MDDSMPSRISPDCPQDIRDVLYHAWEHDLSELKKLLDIQGNASTQDPRTGETPLHATIRACGPADPAYAASSEDAKHTPEEPCVEKAKQILQELFLAGAIWNDTDFNNETPGCVALRLGRQSLYEICVDAGVRAELLFALMESSTTLSLDSGGDKEDEAAAPAAEDMEVDVEEAEAEEAKPEGEAATEEALAENDGVNTAAYLQSSLQYTPSKLLDSNLNGVMMSWETDIMRRSVSALLAPNLTPGKRILNLGFGMGIIDGLFAETKPSKHHIIEAHPSVLEHASKPDSAFGPTWEAKAPQPGAYKILPGKWQDVVPGLVAQGETYDAIYFDTFGEDYGELKMFLMEFVPDLLDYEGSFSFFNGLGADRQVCYDVYTKVVEMHAAEAGFDVDWEDIAVDMTGLAEEGKGEWEGVRRRYWTLESESSSFDCYVLGAGLIID